MFSRDFMVDGFHVDLIKTESSWVSIQDKQLRCGSVLFGTGMIKCKAFVPLELSLAWLLYSLAMLIPFLNYWFNCTSRDVSKLFLFI